LANTKETVDDLLRFFDKHLKGIDNGWGARPEYRFDLDFW
jgi:hypothetical protein